MCVGKFFFQMKVYIGSYIMIRRLFGEFSIRLKKVKLIVVFVELIDQNMSVYYLGFVRYVFYYNYKFCLVCLIGFGFFLGFFRQVFVDVCLY